MDNIGWYGTVCNPLVAGIRGQMFHATFQGINVEGLTAVGSAEKSQSSAIIWCWKNKSLRAWCLASSKGYLARCQFHGSHRFSLKISQWWMEQNPMNYHEKPHWLVVWNMGYFCIYWVSNRPNWRNPIFQRVGSTTNKNILQVMIHIPSASPSSWAGQVAGVSFAGPWRIEVSARWVGKNWRGTRQKALPWGFGLPAGKHTKLANLNMAI